MARPLHEAHVLRAVTCRPFPPPHRSEDPSPTLPMPTRRATHQIHSACDVAIPSVAPIDEEAPGLARTRLRSASLPKRCRPPHWL